MAKKIIMSAKPTVDQLMDNWVSKSAPGSLVDERPSSTQSIQHPPVGEEIKKKSFTIKIDEQLHTRFKIYCAKNQISMSEFIENAIAQPLQNDTPN